MDPILTFFCSHYSYKFGRATSISIEIPAYLQFEKRSTLEYRGFKLKIESKPRTLNEVHVVLQPVSGFW